MYENIVDFPAKRPGRSISCVYSVVCLSVWQDYWRASMADRQVR